MSSKEIREAYLDAYLEKKFSAYNLRPKIKHYGHLGGANEAKFCDIGIMLGSFLPPDAVEIAMALEFIQDRLPNVVLPTENNLWTWRESNSVRTYKDDFAIIEEIARRAITVN